MRALFDEIVNEMVRYPALDQQAVAGKLELFLENVE